MSAHRIASIFAAVAVVAGSWAVARPTAAAPLPAPLPAIEILREDLTLSVAPGSITICPDEKATVSVALETETTYRDSNDPASTLRTMTRPSGLAAVVRAQADDASIGVISPQFQPALPPGSTARFTVQGGKPGRTILRVSETQNGGYRAQEIQIVVDDCSYMVDLRSNWKTAAGFQPDMLSISVGNMVQRTSIPGEYQGNGTSQNSAWGVPIGGCVPSFTVSSGQIRLKGTVDSGTLTLDIEYNPVVADTNVVCLIIPGGTNSVATPRPIQVRAPAYQDSNHNLVHILDAFGGTPGMTWIRIHLIRIPS